MATAGVEPDGVGGLHLWIVHEGAGEVVEGKPDQVPVTFLQALGKALTIGHIGCEPYYVGDVHM